MATDKSMIMVFEGGPHDNYEMKWTISDDPPPKSHSFWDKDGVHLYERKDITPHSERIEYIYEYVKNMEREKEENQIRRRSEGWG